MNIEAQYLQPADLVLRTGVPAKVLQARMDECWVVIVVDARSPHNR